MFCEKHQWKHSIRVHKRANKSNLKEVWGEKERRHSQRRFFQKRSDQTIRLLSPWSWQADSLSHLGVCLSPSGRGKGKRGPGVNVASCTTSSRTPTSQAIINQSKRYPGFTWMSPTQLSSAALSEGQWLEAPRFLGHQQKSDIKQTGNTNATWSPRTVKSKLLNWQINLSKSIIEAFLSSKEWKWRAHAHVNAHLHSLQRQSDRTSGAGGGSETDVEDRRSLITAEPTDKVSHLSCLTSQHSLTIIHNT